MELIDTHIHFWSPGTHPWVADKSHPANKFGIGNFNMLYNNSDCIL